MTASENQGISVGQEVTAMEFRKFFDQNSVFKKFSPEMIWYQVVEEAARKHDEHNREQAIYDDLH